MNDPLYFIRHPDYALSTPVKILVDHSITPRQQIEETIARLTPRCCRVHSHEQLTFDVRRTLAELVDCHSFTVSTEFQRCARCPFDHPELVQEFRRLRSADSWNLGYLCGAATMPPTFANYQHEPNWNSETRPHPIIPKTVPIDLDLTETQQRARLLREITPTQCPFDETQRVHEGLNLNPTPLVVKATKITANFSNYGFDAYYQFCGTCALEALGASPDEARGRFDNFIIDPPEIQKHLEICRAYANDPKGILWLTGLVGNGKTHLSMAILLAALRCGQSGRFIKFRHLLEQHRESKRPVAFGDERPVSPLRVCQTTGLLVLDDLREAKDNWDMEDLLLDLMDARIGRHLPTVITTNIVTKELENTLGSRIYDRLRGACYAVVEFNFPSKRGPLNGDYLKRD